MVHGQQGAGWEAGARAAVPQDPIILGGSTARLLLRSRGLCDSIDVHSRVHMLHGQHGAGWEPGTSAALPQDPIIPVSYTHLTLPTIPLV